MGVGGIGQSLTGPLSGRLDRRPGPTRLPGEVEAGPLSGRLGQAALSAPPETFDRVTLSGQDPAGSQEKPTYGPPRPTGQGGEGPGPGPGEPSGAADSGQAAPDRRLEPRSGGAPVKADSGGTSEPASGASGERESGGAEGAAGPGPELTPEEEAEVKDLQQRDREVRQHEQAHVAAGGRYVSGGASYAYETGPDGKKYAVGGEVSIDASAVPGDPAATIRKAGQVKRAALAPARPSAQDRNVAAKAGQMETRARMDLAEMKREEVSRKTGSSGAGEVAVFPDQDGTEEAGGSARANISASGPPGTEAMTSASVISESPPQAASTYRRSGHGPSGSGEFGPAGFGRAGLEVVV